MKSFSALSRPTCTVNRNSAYEDVLTMYEGYSLVSAYQRTFYRSNSTKKGNDEADMFTAFWNKAYTHLCKGSITVLPMVHSLIDTSTFVTLGKIFSYVYLAALE